MTNDKPPAAPISTCAPLITVSQSCTIHPINKLRRSRGHKLTLPKQNSHISNLTYPSIPFVTNSPPHPIPAMSLIQLQPHPFTSIPTHPSLSTDPSRPDLHHYINTALHEALELLHSIPSTFTADPKPRPSPPSQAKVKLLRGWRNPSEPHGSNQGRAKDKSEFWVCRQSEHVDEASKGTASWREFEAGLRSEHAEHEMEYTPSVSAVERLLEWAPAEIGEVEVDGIMFRGVSMEG